MKKELSKTETLPKSIKLSAIQPVFVNSQKVLPSGLAPAFVNSQKVLNTTKQEARENIKANLKQFNTDFVNSQNRSSVDTTKQLAGQLKCGEQKASRIMQIIENAPEEDKEKLRKGEATVNQVYKKVKKTKRDKR